MTVRTTLRFPVQGATEADLLTAAKEGIARYAGDDWAGRGWEITGMDVRPLLTSVEGQVALWECQVTAASPGSGT